MKGHGTHASYSRGCRCFHCRIENSRYQKSLRTALAKGDGSRRSADRARRHVLRLSDNGVGKRAIEKATGLNERTIWAIRSGRVKTIFRRTEALILGVDEFAARPNARINAIETRERIEHLLSEGFTRKSLADRLGYHAPALQIGKRLRITARNAARVASLYRKVMTI